MKLTNQIEATREQFKAIVDTYPKGEPVVMVNLVKYKSKVEGSEESGLDSYMRYGQNVAPMVEKVGGKMLWMGQVNQTIIGDSEDQPHAVVIVEYPNIESFISMAASPEYKEIAGDRVQALEYGGLLATKTIKSTFSK